MKSSVCYLLKYLLIILLLANSFCYGQGPRFQLFLTKSCTNTEQLDTSYYLSQVGANGKTFFPKSGTVYLPATGLYRIGFNQGPVLTNPEVDIRDTGLFVMRYKEPRIQRYESGATDTPPIFVKCDSVMNGYQEDYYENGTLKMRGNFKNGQTKDSIVTFHPNGNLKRKFVIFHKTFNTHEYDSLGHLVRQNIEENKSFMTYRQHKEKTFFPNGNIASEESSVKRVVRRTVFYSSGQVKLKQTKNYRTEYYESGLKSQEFKWKYKKNHDGGETTRDFTINRTWFDKNEHIFLSAVYKDLNHNFPQPDLHIYRSDWIVSLIKYQEGKVVFILKDFDTKELLTTHAGDFDNLPELDQIQ